jgi:outer membrane lipoprotein carrier protein
MMKFRYFAILLIAFHAVSVCAQGLKSLENFVQQVKTGRASFVQTVTSPAKEGQAAKVKNSSGTFAFARPSRFRFDYSRPFEQILVADGQTLWLFDVDLNQVTTRAQAQTLGSTPAALIAAAADLKALEKDFSLQDLPDAEGLQWMQATPKSREGQLQSIRVGFRGADLTVLEILDSFGQRSVIRFSRFEVNPILPANQFQFKPPAGADVVRQ